MWFYGSHLIMVRDAQGVDWFIGLYEGVRYRQRREPRFGEITINGRRYPVLE